MSVPPPAPKGTMMRTALLGHCWAWAGMPQAKAAAANAAPASLIFCFMNFLLL